MKKVAICLIVTLLALCLAGYTPGNEIPGEESKSISQGLAQEGESASVVTDPEIVLEEYGAEMLLEGTWNDAQSIRVDNLVMWYGYRIIDSVNVSDYRRDGKDGLYFPEDEFEKLIYDYFGLAPEHLRKSETYNAEEKAYVTPTALYDLAETEYAITKTDYEGDEMKIYFDLKIADKDPVSRILTVDTQNGGMRFVSCK